MILADTSVWVDHLRLGIPQLAEFLREDQILIHPLIIEEIACGRLLNRAELLGLLEALPAAPQAEHAEVLDFLAAHRLAGSGIGAVDAHLLCSAKLSGAKIWSRDRALILAARRLEIASEN